MTRLEERCAEAVAAECHLHKSLIEALISYGLLDLRAAERLLIRRRVEQLVGEGVGRCEAMWRTGEELGCSYEKARAAVYTKK